MNDSNASLSELIRKQIRRRFTVVIFIFLIPVLAILGRIIQIQFIEGKAWRTLARQQLRENVEVAPNRGNIYARDGQLMASTVPSYALYMDFQAINPDTFFHYLNPLSYQLAEELNDKSAQDYRLFLIAGYKKRSREYLITKKRVTHTALRRIQQFPLFNKGRNQSGLYEKKYFRREKPFGSLASRTIGDIFGELPKNGRYGKNGLEMHYDSLLRGTPGLCVRQKVAGEYISVITKEPEDGLDLVSTIDVYYQDILETSLSNELKNTNATSGTAMLMNVKTGEVLAITNLTVVDSGSYVESTNFAVSDQSEPGSTFKTFSMIVALEDGYIKPEDSVDTGNGRMPMYGRTMSDHNWSHGGYHKITAAKSIWYSSNIGISSLIDQHYKNNPSKFVDGLYRMGLNKPFDLEIPGSGVPVIPHPKDKRYWAKTDLPWMSIGYVTQIPPIYTLAYYNAIANDGKLMKPYFVRSIQKNGHDIKSFSPVVLNQRICSKKTLNQIHDMLDSVVVHGTGSAINSPFVSIAGKTGTAQISKGAMGYKNGGVSYQVSFCGYFPADKPVYSGIVVIRDPKVGYASGGTMAGGVFREMAERIYARETRLSIDENTDQSAPEVPYVKSGNGELTKRLLNKLNVSKVVLNNPVSNWVKTDREEKSIGLMYREIPSKLVPDVKNMGARDAVYLLGSMGLFARISGQGKVVTQSPQAGTLYNRGQVVSLLLK